MNYITLYLHKYDLDAEWKIAHHMSDNLQDHIKCHNKLAEYDDINDIKIFEVKEITFEDDGL